MRRVLTVIAVLLILFCGTWILSRVTARSPDSLDIMFSRVRIGMSLDEAITALWDKQ